MKKSIIIAVIILLVGVIGFVFYNNRVVSTITLDINPSIEINLTKNNKVKSVNALNDDAKDIVGNLNGKSLNDTIEAIAERVIEKGYTDGDFVTIILHSEGNINNNEVAERLNKSFQTKNIGIDIIKIDKISKEDEKIAKKYGISAAKASYINNIKKDNENVSFNDLINKSTNELKETKETGKYCEANYILEGDFCLKEVNRVPAAKGEVCPRNYYEYNGTCYEEVGVQEKDILFCSDGFNLINNKCEKEEYIDAEPEYYCEKGTFKTEGEIRWHNWKGGPACVDESTGKAPVLRCMIGPHLIIDGKCHVGPAPTINGGCPNGDKLVGGGCYSLDPGDQWQCPDGNIYEKSKKTYVEICPDTLTYTKPTIKSYSCKEGYDLKDNKCYRKETQDPQREKYCKEGYTLVENARCINLSKTANKETGNVCNQINARLRGNSCVIYEMIDAKHN